MELQPLRGLLFWSGRLWNRVKWYISGSTQGFPGHKLVILLVHANYLIVHSPYQRGRKLEVQLLCISYSKYKSDDSVFVKKSFVCDENRVIKRVSMEKCTECINWFFCWLVMNELLSRGQCWQSSYLSRISRFISLEKQLLCGEISAFHVWQLWGKWNFLHMWRNFSTIDRVLLQFMPFCC